MATGKLKVLVAEDEPAMLSLVSRHLRSLGFDVVEASEGDVAWDLALDHRPDLVLLDVMMPGMSGWEVCKRLKDQSAEGEVFEKTAVVMLTGIGENLNDMTSSLFQADAWLNKPFDFAILDRTLSDTLGRFGHALPSAGKGRGNGQTSGRGAAALKKSASKVAQKSPAKKAAKPAKRAPVKAAKKVAKSAAKRPATAPRAAAAKSTKRAAAKKTRGR